MDRKIVYRSGRFLCDNAGKYSLLIYNDVHCKYIQNSSVQPAQSHNRRLHLEENSTSHRSSTQNNNRNFKNNDNGNREIGAQEQLATSTTAAATWQKAEQKPPNAWQGQHE